MIGRGGWFVLREARREHYFARHGHFSLCMYWPAAEGLLDDKRERLSRCKACEDKLKSKEPPEGGSRSRGA